MKDTQSISFVVNLPQGRFPLFAETLAASSQNNFLSSQEYDNLMNIGLAGLSNRGS